MISDNNSQYDFIHDVNMDELRDPDNSNELRFIAVYHNGLAQVYKQNNTYFYANYMTGTENLLEFPANKFASMILASLLQDLAISEVR